MTASTVILNKGGGGDRIASELDSVTGVDTLAVRLQTGPDGSAESISANNPLPVTTTQTAIAKGEVTGVAQFLKFGKNSDIDTTTTPEDTWNGGGLYTGFPTEVETLEIFSSSSADTAAGTGARTVTITNLLDGSGVRMPDITVTLNGTTPVSLGAQTYNRCNRIIVVTAGTGGQNAGELTLRHTTTTANIFAVMPAGTNQTAICAYTVPAGHTLYIDHVDITLSRRSGAAGSANVSLRSRKLGEVFQSKLLPSVTEAQKYTQEAVYTHILPARTDVVIRIDDVSDNNTIIAGELSGTLEAD